MTKHVGWAVGALGLLVLGCAGTSDGPAGSGGNSGASDTASGGHLPGAPASQGASTVTVKSSSLAPTGKSCPVTAVTSSIPPVTGPEALDGNTYLHWVVDGEGSSAVSCRVAGNSSFTFEGKISSGGKALEIKNGVLGTDLHGTATITLLDSANLSTPLGSPPASCTVIASHGASDNFQVQAGSIWASFICPSVEAPPSDYCTASGVFVLENCLQK
jgi:hypothetical protein